MTEGFDIAYPLEPRSGLNARVEIKTRQNDMAASYLFGLLLDAVEQALPPLDSDGDDYDDTDANYFGGGEYEFATDAEYTYSEGRYKIRYYDSELTGLDGSVTEISFDENERELVTLTRAAVDDERVIDLAANAAMVFEPGKRHICAYKASGVTLEMCVYTRKVDNDRGPDFGTLSIYYIIEIRVASAQRTRMTLTLKPEKELHSCT